MCQSVLCPRARLSILEGLKRGQPQSQKGAIWGATFAKLFVLIVSLIEGRISNKPIIRNKVLIRHCCNEAVKMFTIPKSWFKGKGSGGRVNVTRVYVTMASRRPPTHTVRPRGVASTCIATRQCAVVIFSLCNVPECFMSTCSSVHSWRTQTWPTPITKRRDLRCNICQTFCAHCELDWGTNKQQYPVILHNCECLSPLHPPLKPLLVVRLNRC